MSAPTALLGRLFGTAEAEAVFSDRARLQGMLDFEAALAAAQSRLGIVPAAAVPVIAARARAELFDLEQWPRQRRPPAIPPSRGQAADRHGAEPTIRKPAGSSIGARPARMPWIPAWSCSYARSWRCSSRPGPAERALAGSRLRTGRRRMVGRTWMQHALPITLGLKAAGCLDAVERHRQRLAELRPRLLVVQLGGAAGTLASLGDAGIPASQHWLASSGSRCRRCPGTATATGWPSSAPVSACIVGTLGKLARDLSLLMQTEVGEIFEPAGEGRGGSSTMPHKRNPVAAAAILSTAVRAPDLVATMLAAMLQEHERGLGGWHAEWETLPELPCSPPVRCAGRSRRSRDWRSTRRACAAIST